MVITAELNACLIIEDFYSKQVSPLVNDKLSFALYNVHSWISLRLPVKPSLQSFSEYGLPGGSSNADLGSFWLYMGQTNYFYMFLLTIIHTSTVSYELVAAIILWREPAR
jgi:hypothetical protein